MMKRRQLLNGPISSVVAQMGHTDTICICDAGLPVPEYVMRIDLAVSPGGASFLDVLKAVGSEMMVEHVTITNKPEEAKPLPAGVGRILDVVFQVPKYVSPVKAPLVVEKYPRPQKWQPQRIFRCGSSRCTLWEQRPFILRSRSLITSFGGTDTNMWT
jgi:D-ribose pyranose/furanose isomerase RbsD